MTTCLDRVIRKEQQLINDIPECFDENTIAMSFLWDSKTKDAIPSELKSQCRMSESTVAYPYIIPMIWYDGLDPTSTSQNMPHILRHARNAEAFVKGFHLSMFQGEPEELKGNQMARGGSIKQDQIPGRLSWWIKRPQEV